jgi:hypothetical protein
MSTLRIVKEDFMESKPKTDGAMRHAADTHAARVFRSALKLDNETLLLSALELDALYENGSRIKWGLERDVLLSRLVDHAYEIDLFIHRLKNWEEDWDSNIDANEPK